jgi:hypothetical protein
MYQYNISSNIRIAKELKIRNLFDQRNKLKMIKF